MEMTIGTTVRVTSVDGKCCRKGYIACTNDDGSCDIIYQRGTDGDEESLVDASRIHQLQPFERENFCGSALDAKVFGNKLFELKDFEAAYEYYIRSHKIMQSSVVSVGKRVIIRIDYKSDREDAASTYSFEGAVVSDMRPDGSIDVIYDDCVLEGEDEEEGVAMERVFIVFKGTFKTRPNNQI
jgi:hypothetical protein